MAQIRCGNRKAHNQEIAAVHHHNCVADVRDCFAYPHGIPSIEEELAYYEDEPEDHYDPDVAYERHLEGCMWQEYAAFAEWEAQMGLIN